MTKIPALGSLFPPGYLLRAGAHADAGTVRGWTSTDSTVDGALKNAVAHLENEDGKCFVVENARTRSVEGVMTLDPPHLQFAYRLEALRGKRIGIRAAAVLIEHYFTTTKEKWLGDSGSLTDAGEKLVDQLGFAWDKASQCSTLTRGRWEEQRLGLAKVVF